MAAGRGGSVIEQMMSNSVPTTRQFSHRSFFPATAQQVYDWHARPGALVRLLPPWQNIRLISHQGGLTPGATALLRLGLGPFALRWQSRHTDNQPGRLFADEQQRGPFAYFRHCHRFNDHDDGMILEDQIDYALPGHQLLPQAAFTLVEEQLRRMFSYRQQVLHHDLLMHQKYSTLPRRILISGASGVIGQALTALLSTGGHQVWRLVRRPPRPEAQEIFWDIDRQQLDSRHLEGFSAVIHLAGEYIGLQRWRAAGQEKVLASRRDGTSLLSRTLAGLQQPPEVLLCASAVGYYGDCGRSLVNEQSPPGTGFMASVCQQWEEAARPAEDAGIRTVRLRLGVGLSARGGALPQLTASEPLGIFRHMGTGQQYISWIAIDDLLAAVLHCLCTRELRGPVNIVAPSPATNQEMMAALAAVTGRPLLPGLPAWLLRGWYGQMAKEIVLAGCRVSCDRLRQSGFVFRYPQLIPALALQLGRLPATTPTETTGE